MADPITAAIGGVTSLVGSSMSARTQSDAADDAASAQANASKADIAERRRQFNLQMEIMAPFVEGGGEAFQAMLNLAGLGGDEAQAAALAGIEAGPQAAFLNQAGEEAILQNAAATGGLRGGNVQDALARNRQGVFSGLIDQQYARLGGLASIGQAGAAQQAAASQNFASGAGQAYQQIGAARAGSALAQGQARANMIGDITGLVGQGLGYASMGKSGSGGGWF